MAAKRFKLVAKLDKPNQLYYDGRWWVKVFSQAPSIMQFVLNLSGIGIFLFPLRLVSIPKVLLIAGFSLRRFRDPIRVPRISNQVPRIRENYHRAPKIRENRVPRIREIGSLQIHTRYLTFSLKKTCDRCFQFFQVSSWGVYHSSQMHCCHGTIGIF